MKQLLGSSDTFFPTPVVLVGSGTEETTNIITVAWGGMVCSEPPTIAIYDPRERIHEDYS